MISPTEILPLECWVLVSLVILLGRYYLNLKFDVLKKWNIPHDPPSIFQFGHVGPIFVDRPFTFPSECKAKYGPIYGYYIFFDPRIAIHDVEILRRVLISEFSNFSYRDEEGISLGCKEAAHGLFSVRGEEWKRIRATLSPAFTAAKLKQMANIINWSVDNTVELFTRKAAENNGIITAKDVFSRLSLDVICSAAFSTDVNSQDDTKGAPTISKEAKKFFKYGIQWVIRYFVVVFSWLEPIYLYLTGTSHVEYFRNLSKSVAEQRNTDGRSSRVDLMQLMLDSKIPESDVNKGVRRGMTPTEIIGNAVIILLAGYETTGTCMSYLAYNLATHPIIQEKLQAEIDDAAQNEKELDFTTVNKLQYLDMCINETLRLYSPVPWTARTAKDTITIKGLKIRKGCAVGIPIYDLCHDPDLWDNPMEFDPSRMRDMSKIDPLIFQPFGTGPRNCIGSKFAMTEMKLAFSRILQKFSFEITADTPKPPLELAFGITTRPKVNFSLRVVPRSVGRHDE